jgi:hypothetical protein
LLAMNNEMDAVDKRKAQIEEIRWMLPLFIIWGIQWILHAGLDIAEEWVHLPRVQEMLLLLALAASVGVISRAVKWRRVTKSENVGSLESSAAPWLMLLPGLALVIAVWMLEMFGAVGPFFAPLFRSVVVAFGFAALGIVFGRELIYLGAWLFALAVISVVWYLGYSYVIMEGMGGISLVAGGSMLNTWGNNSKEVIAWENP